MIQLDIAVFLLLIESLVVLAVLFLIWVMRSRKLADALAMALSRLKVLVKRPDARHYLLTESNITRDHARALGAGDQVALKILTLRAEFLQMEHDVADKQERDQPFWDALSKQMDALLANHDAVAAEGRSQRNQSGHPQEYVADAGKAQGLFEEQTSIIQHLKKQVREAVNDTTKAEILEKQIDRITSANRELSYCVATLESEIVMLHEKITMLERQKRAMLDSQPAKSP